MHNEFEKGIKSSNREILAHKKRKSHKSPNVSLIELLLDTKTEEETSVWQQPETLFLQTTFYHHMICITFI